MRNHFQKAIAVSLTMALAGCSIGAGSAITGSGPVTSLASLVEHKGTVPGAPVLAAKLGVTDLASPAQAKAAPAAAAGGKPMTFARVTAANSLGWVRDQKVEAYLNGIVARLQQGLPKPKAVRVFITGHSGYTASATPDDEILVAIGFLQKCKSEGELAAVLAHELAHILLAHYTRELETRKIIEAAGFATQAGIMAAVISESQRDKTQPGYHYTLKNEAAARDKMFTAMKAGSYAVTFFDDIASSTLSREQEFEADMLGMDLLARGGYKPVHMKRLLDVMLEQWKETEKTRKTLADRLGERIGSALQVSVLGVLMGANSDAIAQSVRDEMIDFGVSEVGRALTQTHPSPQARGELASAYIEKHHATGAGVDAVFGRYDETVGSRHFKAVMKGYAHFFEAMRLSSDRKLTEALKEVDQGLAGPLAHHAGGRHLAYQILTELGDHEAAYKSLLADKPAGNAPVSYYSALAWHHARRGKLNEAFAVLDAGERDYGDSSMFLPARVRLMKAFGGEQRLALAMKGCHENKIDEIRTACRNAAAGGMDTISDRESRGLLERAKQDDRSGQQGTTTLIERMTGAKFPRPW